MKRTATKKTANRRAARKVKPIEVAAPAVTSPAKHYFAVMEDNTPARLHSTREEAKKDHYPRDERRQVNVFRFVPLNDSWRFRLVWTRWAPPDPFSNFNRRGKGERQWMWNGKWMTSDEAWAFWSAACAAFPDPESLLDIPPSGCRITGSEYRWDSDPRRREQGLAVVANVNGRRIREYERQSESRKQGFTIDWAVLVELGEQPDGMAPISSCYVDPCGIGYIETPVSHPVRVVYATDEERSKYPVDVQLLIPKQAG